MALKYKTLRVGPRAFRMPVRPAKDGRGKWLASLVKEHSWTCGAEVGVFRGENLFYLLETCPMLRMIGVDAWRKRPECGIHRFGAAYSNVDMDLCFEQVQARAQKYFNRLELYRMDSIEAAEWFPDEYFDFVFIDASHDTDSVLADIKAWLPKVKYGGYLTGHDHIHPGVLPAVNQALPNARHVTTDNCWEYQKC